MKMQKKPFVITLLCGIAFVFMFGCTPIEGTVAEVKAKAEAENGDKYSNGIPVIKILTNPTPMTNVTFENIKGNLTVVANVTNGAALSYQWYSNTAAVNAGGTALENETNAIFPIPTNLSFNSYNYYFCEVSASGGAAPVRSSVATVYVTNQPTLGIANFNVSGTLKTYNGSGQGATVTYNGTGINVVSAGAIIVYYYSVSYPESIILPINVGTYDIRVETDGGTEYAPFLKSSLGTLTIEKAPGEAVSVPVLASRTTNSITIEQITAASGQNVEYVSDTSNTVPSTGWQSGLTFSSLTPGTTYYIFARSVSNDNYHQGATSAALITETFVSALFTLSFEQVADDNAALPWTGGGSALTVLLSGSSATLTLGSPGQYTGVKWYVDGVYMNNANSYVLKSADFNHTDLGMHSLTVEVKTLAGDTYNRTIPFQVTE